MRPEPDVEPLNKEWYEGLEKDVDLSRLYMSEPEIIEEFNNCVNHDHSYDEIIEQFEWLIEDHNS